MDKLCPIDYVITIAAKRRELLSIVGLGSLDPLTIRQLGIFLSDISRGLFRRLSKERFNLSSFFLTTTTFLLGAVYSYKKLVKGNF